MLGLDAPTHHRALVAFLTHDVTHRLVRVGLERVVDLDALDSLARQFARVDGSLAAEVRLEARLSSIGREAGAPQRPRDKEQNPYANGDQQFAQRSQNPHAKSRIFPRLLFIPMPRSKSKRKQFQHQPPPKPKPKTSPPWVGWLFFGLMGAGVGLILAFYVVWQGDGHWLF